MSDRRQSRAPLFTSVIPNRPARCATTRSAPRSTRSSYFRDEWSTLPPCWPVDRRRRHTLRKKLMFREADEARRLVCAQPPFRCLSPVNTEALGGRILSSCARDYLLATAAQELIFGRNVAPRALGAFVQTHCRRRCCGCRRHRGHVTTSLKPVSAPPPGRHL